MTRDGLRLFYADDEAVQDGRVLLGAEESAHARRVLKMKAGAVCRVATEEGEEYLVRLTEISREGIAAEIIKRLPERPPAPLWISLGVPLLKGEGFERVLEKGCELGASAFHPLLLEKREVRLSERKSAGRRERWRRIALEAAKQCDRAPPPTIHPPRGLDDYLRETRDFGLKLMGSLQEGAVPVKETLARAHKRVSDTPLRVAILTGPEGDLSNEESRRAIDADFAPISLGPRILRADTAPLSLLTIVQHTLGDMG